MAVGEEADGMPRGLNGGGLSEVVAGDATCAARAIARFADRVSWLPSIWRATAPGLMSTGMSCAISSIDHRMLMFPSGPIDLHSQPAHMSNPSKVQ